MVRVKPIDVDALDALQAVHAKAERWMRQGEGVTRGAVSFYERTGHAFLAEDDEGVRGFVLAQAVWDGVRPIVRMNRLVIAEPTDEEARNALLEALTKSAYDAAVYDLVAEVDGGDDAAQAWLEANAWQAQDVRLYERTLGSRGNG
mgnify:CR=1 FL=1